MLEELKDEIERLLNNANCFVQQIEDLEAKVKTLRAELAAAQPAPEPCGQVNDGIACPTPRRGDERLCPDCNPRKAQPASPARQPLTDGRIDELAHEMVKGGKSANWLARAIEQAHDIGEKP